MPAQGATPPNPATRPTTAPNTDAGATPQNAGGEQENAARPDAPREPRISDTTAMLMIGAGILFDLISALPLVGWIGSGFGIGTFILWFLILGLPLISPKTIANWGLNIFAEGATAVGTAGSGWWPAFTIGAILTVVITRAEDKLGIDVLGAIKNPAQATQLAQQLPGALKAQLQRGISSAETLTNSGATLPERYQRTTEDLRQLVEETGPNTGAQRPFYDESTAERALVSDVRQPTEQAESSQPTPSAGATRSDFDTYYRRERNAPRTGATPPPSTQNRTPVNPNIPSGHNVGNNRAS